jgi:hypothetical protein
MNHPGMPGNTDAPRISWSRFAGFQATVWVIWCRSSNSSECAGRGRGVAALAVMEDLQAVEDGVG